jgi:DNA repair protein RecO (recombination protein O)
MSIQKTSALVLKSINWKDSSKITTLFTRELGKMDVIAKGAKKAGSRYRGLLESLNSLEVLIYFSANRELQTLGDVSLENSFTRLRGDLTKTGYALSILELVDAFFAYNNPDITFFDFSKQILYTLEESDNEQMIFWYYLLKLASYLGFKPDFTICRKCGRRVLGDKVIFSLSEGSVLCPDCIPPGDNQSAMAKTEAEVLAGLQQMKHTKISSFKTVLSRPSNFTDFLVRYLEFHTGQKLALSSLKLLISY